MHIIARHDIFYKFSSSVINVKNKEKEIFFVAHFHNVFRQHLLTPIDLCPKICSKWKSLQSYIILEDSNFGLNFREVSVAIILNLFWVVFRGILPRILSNLYKSLTSDAIKLSNKKKNEFLILRAFRSTLSRRYIIVVSFINIPFVVLKLKISNSASTKQIFLGGFWALTLPICANIAEILTNCSTLANKCTVSKSFERLKYLWKKDGPKFSTFGPTLNHLFLLKMAKIEKK